MIFLSQLRIHSYYDSIANDLFWKGYSSFESNTTNLFLKLVKKSKIILDIGANNGYFSLLAAKYKPDAKIFAFEPVPRIYNQLIKNISINNLKNITAFQAAVSDKTEDKILYIPKVDFPTSASLLEGFRDNVDKITCKTIAIDNIFKDKINENIDLIKIDTEATEHEVLNGMQSELKNSQPDIICEVLANRTERKLESILEKYGYNFYWIKEKLVPMKNIIGDPTYQYKNYLFSKNNEQEITKSLQLIL